MHDEDLKLNDQALLQEPEDAMQMQAPSPDQQLVSEAIAAEVNDSGAVAATEIEVVQDNPVAAEGLAQLLGAEPVPDISTLTAARDAAAFVAQIFADPSISDAADAEVTQAEELTEVTQAEVVELPPVPALWPQGAAQHLQGQRVLILGLGISGIAMARWCVRAGADVTVADTREAPPFLPALQAELPGVRFVAGEFTAALVDGQSLSSVYRSPGLSPASVAPVFNAARSIGLPTGGELDLFAFALKGLREAHGYAPKVLGITGTNGKTTTGRPRRHGDVHRRRRRGLAARPDAADAGGQAAG